MTAHMLTHSRCDEQIDRIIRKTRRCVDQSLYGGTALGCVVFSLKAKIIKNLRFEVVLCIKKNRWLLELIKYLTMWMQYYYRECIQCEVNLSTKPV